MARKKTEKDAYQVGKYCFHMETQTNSSLLRLFTVIIYIFFMYWFFSSPPSLLNWVNI